MCSDDNITACNEISWAFPPYCIYTMCEWQLGREEGGGERGRREKRERGGEGEEGEEERQKPFLAHLESGLKIHLTAYLL